MTRKYSILVLFLIFLTLFSYSSYALTWIRPIGNTTVLNVYVNTSTNDTRWSIDNIFLTNQSNILTFNAALMNSTIDARSSGGNGSSGPVNDVWVNVTGDAMSGNLSFSSTSVVKNTNKNSYIRFDGQGNIKMGLE